MQVCLLLLITMLWYRQAIFESKGGKLSSSAECSIRTQSPRHQIASRLNVRWQTDWTIEDQAKNLTRQPVPMISEFSVHSTPLPVGFRIWLWRYTWLLFLISMLWDRQAIFRMISEHSTPPYPTIGWLLNLALAIYMFVVVNFDYLSQASDFPIERRQVVFLCWIQDSNPGSQTPNRQQTECPLTNRLSYRRSS